MDIRIRRPEPDDLDRVAVLFDAYRQFYGQPADLARASGFLRDRYAQRQSVLVIAEHGEQVVGFVQLYPMYSSVQTTPIFILNDLFVAPAGRRQRVGTRLLQAAAIAAQAAGASRLVLEAGRDNHAARALYRAAGWQEEPTQWYSLPLGAEPTMD